MERIHVLVEIDVIEGKTAKEQVEWVERVFMYYHPRLNAKVDIKKFEVTGEPATPIATPVTEDLI